MIEILETASLLFLPFFLVLDLIHRRQKFDAPRSWRPLALLVTAATFFLSVTIAGFWGRVFEGRNLLRGDVLGTGLGALVGILVYELFHYAYHRLAHGSNVLWRAAHQMHHSAESLDAFGANYLHPIDTFMFTSLSSLVFFPLLGLTVEAGMIAAAFLAFSAVFQHANIRTPRWLGYIVQRPESHSVHHGRHRMNYADLPLVDMLFGTFVNPSAFEQEVGFYKGASTRVGEMLVGRDVTRPPANRAPLSPARPKRRAGALAGPTGRIRA